jgi:hypothetical protein
MLAFSLERQGPDMALERDNPAERLARIDKLMASNKSTPAAQQIARLQASLMVVSVPQGPALAVGRTPRRIASALPTFSGASVSPHQRATLPPPTPPGEETPDMTDAKQLVALRAWPGWPWKTLDPLAVEVATMGRLRDAVDEADRLRGEHMVGRSHSGSSNSTAQVPVSDFSDLENRSNVFYKRLRIELHRVLRRGVPLGEWQGWD